MLQRMSVEHVDGVAEIHRTSWSPRELSMKLGDKYIHLFYENIVHSPYSFGYVYLKNDRVIAYATGFYDYHAFNHTFQAKERISLGLTFLNRVLTLNIGPADILNLFNDDKKLRKAKYPKHHLGALALSGDFKSTPDGREAITAVIQGVLNELKSKGFPGCWGLCDFENMPMRKYLLKLGFEETDTIHLVGKSVVLYEKNFFLPEK